MQVIFSYEELQTILRIASLRSGSKAHLDRKESSSGPPSIIRHTLGVKCELAVAKLFDTYIDISFKAEGDKNEPDVYLPNGLGIQVKGKFLSAKENDFSLRTTQIDEFKAEYGILVKDVNKHTVDILGYFTKQTFIEKSIIKSFDYGNKRILEQKYLTPIEILIKDNPLIYSSKSNLNIVSSLRDLHKNKLSNQDTILQYSRQQLLTILDQYKTEVETSYLKFGNFK